MIELFPFQQTASDTIAERFLGYVEDPIVVGTQRHPRAVPFFQALASITASGKTVILADAVATIAEALPVAPVILWLSKARVVVEQSHAHLLAGGRYRHLLGDCSVAWLAEYDATEVAESTRALLYFATVGTFNQKHKDEGSLLIFRSDIDTAEHSTWDALAQRRTAAGGRRPLLVVYDEAHNLSDQQTQLLMELEPAGFLLASATMRLPRLLADEVAELKRRGLTDEQLVTQVDAKAVADAELVKSTLLLAGYRAPMEETVTTMLADMAEAERDARTQGLEGSPKAIYVCQTNIVEGNAYRRDDPRQPFAQRQAPPLVIWRFLVEGCGVDPATIAIYSSALAFHREYPPPPELVLFRGGESDYGDFTAGGYRHVIFNLSLQEGWDDPLCYFAYVDKSMESRVQVEQVIGRVLRQPGARHYGSERLNAAHFYVRVDRNEVFSELIRDVSKQLAASAPEIRIVSAPPERPKPIVLAPKGTFEIPATAYDAIRARDPIGELIDTLSDYRFDAGENVTAAGERSMIRHRIGERGPASVTWETFETSSRVSARWIFQREVRRRFANALGVCDLSSPKFDASIGLGSSAHRHVARVAEEVVDAYLDNVVLTQRRSDPHRVGAVFARPEQMTTFQHAVHDGYDGLNSLEAAFAQALDERGEPWMRNPSRSGYGIPLITIGSTARFFPDFVVWREGAVIAVDTKGGHLLQDAMARKLLRIDPPRDGAPRLIVRFVSQGQWTAAVEQVGPDGYTVWGIKQDGTRRAVPVAQLEDALERVLDTTLD